jgi:archaeosortase A (PGF-CTERM-specific)
MMIKSILPFIAIGLFILALLFRKREVAASGWIVFAGYCCFETYECFVQGDYLYTTYDLLFLAFSLFVAFLIVTRTEKEDLFFSLTKIALITAALDLFFSLTKIALITAALYFPFAEISVLGDSLIHITATITATMLNLFNPGSVYMDSPPSYIYSSFTPYDVEIILACTAIESIVLFTGLICGVNAPMRRKLKAFLVSVPVIYVSNILRNVFVITAYFEQWFASPRWQWLLDVRLPPAQSFDIAHNVLARTGSMVILIVIAYAVFMILPEALDLIEGLARVISRKRNV